MTASNVSSLARPGIAAVATAATARVASATRLATLAALASVLVLSGCSVLSSPPPPVTYDLGPLAGTPSRPPAPLPRLRVAQTDGPIWMDGNSLYYRLQYAQAERLQPYATQRWVESPPRLFDDRLREAVAARGALTWFGDTSVPALKVDLVAFEQVFDSATTSRGVVRARVTVYHKGLIGQKTFVAEQPAPSADGAGGVRALASSSDAVIAAILDWAATLPLESSATASAAPALPPNRAAMSPAPPPPPPAPAGQPSRR